VSAAWWGGPTSAGGRRLMGNCGQGLRSHVGAPALDALIAEDLTPDDKLGRRDRTHGPYVKPEMTRR